MKEIHNKGLSYNCDEKYLPGHRCKIQPLYLLDGTMMEEEDLSQEPETSGTTETNTGHQDILETGDSLEISLHAISGTTAPQAMRVRGTAGRHPVVVLIDSRSTHNFVDPKTAKKAGIAIQRNGALEVMVANGERLFSLGHCEQVNLFIQGISVNTDFYLLILERCEVVLGTHWLRTLGPILWDFSNLWMKFKLQGLDYYWKGESIQSPSVLNPSKLRKTIRGKGALLQLCSLQGVPSPTELDLGIESLLSYEGVFEEPKGFPPPRSQDHKIPQIEGTKLVFVRPYRCPHCQKKMR